MMAAATTATILAAALGASTASALSVSPPSTAFTATAINWQFVMGTQTLTCNAVTSTGVTPAGGSAASLTLAAPAFTTCSSALGHYNVTSPAPWNVEFGASGTATIAFPMAGIHISYLSGLCTVTFAPTAPTTIGATWANGSPSSLQLVNQPLRISTTGFCPGIGTASTVSANFSVPGVTVT